MAGIRARRDLKAEVQGNLLRYGTPTLGGGYGGLKSYSAAERVRELFNTVGVYNPLEIHIRPSDPDANHYELDWYVLAYHDGRMRRAMEVEQEVKAKQQADEGGKTDQQEATQP